MDFIFIIIWKIVKKFFIIACYLIFFRSILLVRVGENSVERDKIANDKIKFSKKKVVLSMFRFTISILNSRSKLIYLV